MNYYLKSTTKKLLAVMISTCLAVTGVIACFDNAPAYADTISLSEDNVYIVSYLESNCTHDGIIWGFDTWEDLTITDVKSSNKKIATASASGSYIWVDVKERVGKTVISFVVNGEKMSHDFTFYYKNPMSKCTVAGKNVRTKFDKKNEVMFKKLNKKKVYVKAKSGWVITKYTTCYKDSYKEKKLKTPKKTLSLTVKTKYPYDGIEVYLYNKKLGVEEVINIKQAYGNGYYPGG